MNYSTRKDLNFEIRKKYCNNFIYLILLILYSLFIYNNISIK